jgi:hydroxypyruvate isomerase
MSPAATSPVGEINYRNVFKAIRELGFRQFVAMEYMPSKDAMTTLARSPRAVSTRVHIAVDIADARDW